jgi:hypothetical protein
LVAALRCYLDKKPAEAVIWLERYDRLNQDLLLCLLPLVARLSEDGIIKSDPRELRNVIVQLDRLTAQIRPAAQLAIEKMCFCDLIEKYGVYHVVDEDHTFQPGESVQVYVELANFQSELIASGYRIRLRSTMEVQDYSGKPAHRWDFGNREYSDVSRTPRHDFFINYPLQMPNIPPGAYTLRLEIMDVPTRRKVARTLDFRIMSARGAAPCAPVEIGIQSAHR